MYHYRSVGECYEEAKSKHADKPVVIRQALEVGHTALNWLLASESESWRSFPSVEMSDYGSIDEFELERRYHMWRSNQPNDEPTDEVDIGEAWLDIGLPEAMTLVHAAKVTPTLSERLRGKS
jgi:hypothetical protein